MIELIPSVLVTSREEFETKLRQVEHECKTIHVDILDGSLFPNTTWFDARSVGNMRTDVQYEIHLMVENPLPIVEAWKRHVAQLVRAIVHAEMHRPLGVILNHLIDDWQLETGVAINPETPLHEIEGVLHQIHQLTIMGVHPGSSGQPFEGDYILEKILQAHRHRPELPIEIDGGVTTENIKSLAEAGATRICAASLLFGAEHPSLKLKELQETLSTFS